MARIWRRGGTIPRLRRDGDLIPALLSPGGPVVTREQAETLGLTADARRLPSADELPDG